MFTASIILQIMLIYLHIIVHKFMHVKPILAM